MNNNFGTEIYEFIKQARNHGVKMIMVGGGAVNFHGYQRHSADVDFWIDTSDENLAKLVKTFKSMGYDIEDFPDDVKEERQNISVKFSPDSLALELITKFSLDKTFEQAYANADIVNIEGEQILKWRVLAFDDLVTSKIKSSRPKDLLDIQELQRIRNK